MLPAIAVTVLVVAVLTFERGRAWWRSNEWRRIARGRDASRRVAR
jgi:hypothetical protein